MCRHYFAAALIGLLALITGFQHVSAQSQLAQDVYAIFEANCLNCHGPNGAFRETLLMEHGELIDGGTVVPENPNASELYKRLLGPTENGAQMPFRQPQLPAQSIDAVRRWILAGAPDWKFLPPPDNRFISFDEILKSIENHLMSLSKFDRPFARYFTLTHLYNAGETKLVLQEYRKALSKLVNSLSWGNTITNPLPIDVQETIFYIDLRRYKWDKNDGWTRIENEYPYHIPFDGPTQTALRKQLFQLQTQMECKTPFVHVDWFVATASTPPLYHDLLSLPRNDWELEEKLGIDVKDNLRNAPGIRVHRAGFLISGVSENNRVVERHDSDYGAYWKSYDFAGNVNEQNVFHHPLTFTQDGGEVIFNLPNGLQAYLIVDGAGFRLDKAPINIVSNPAASDPAVRNGISCFGCHVEGMKSFDDKVRAAIIKPNVNLADNKEHALRLYTEASEMDTFIRQDTDRYKGALEATGNSFDDVEPISRFHEAFNGPVYAPYVAGVLGLETNALLEKIRGDLGRQNPALVPLDIQGGSIKRDTWRANFLDTVNALYSPASVVKPPVETRQEVIPGRLIDIPDPNLRAVLEEALGTKTIRPTTMAKLTTLKASNRNIKNLTGLEFAINLKELWISRNPISDLSPLSGCADLVGLGAWGVPVSDLSPLAGLKKLRWLEFVDGSISNLSPLSGLTNLRRLVLYTQDISDISPLANLTNLTLIRMTHNDIENLSPLSKLINLTTVFLYDNEISDLTPLSKLHKLETLNLCDNKISDVSPLRNLTRLSNLGLCRNKVSDISPLARLTNLDTLDLARNNISNVAPLRSLVNLRQLDVTYNRINDITPLAPLDSLDILWGENPGFPRGGPKIEGPWLWTWIPASHHHGWDMISEATGGTVTEWQIATHGAIEGQPGGSSAWTSHKLSPTGHDNIRELTGELGWAPGRELYDIVLYGCVELYSPREQKTDMYLGCDDGARVWLNGREVFHKWRSNGVLKDYNIHFPVTLKQGKNILFVALDDRDYQHWSAFFGFARGTEYSTFSPTAQERSAIADVNRDGAVDILDLIFVAKQTGENADANSPADVNGDGVVDVSDVIQILQMIDMNNLDAAPATVSANITELIETCIAHAQRENDGSIDFQLGIEKLQRLLIALKPSRTALLSNYPNPFNPETWIPYQLAVPAEVVLTIYDMNGGVVRRLEMGHQAAGMYRNRSRAAYWDGRNQEGESVASGLYFYTLKAGEFAGTRKMLIRK